MDETELFKFFGARVKYYRKHKGWNQLEMALELGMHPNELSNIECGRRNPTLKTVFKIACVLNVDIKDLFEFRE